MEMSAEGQIAKSLQEVSAQPKKKKRLGYMDIARGIAMLCIIMGHFGIATVNRFVYSFIGVSNFLPVKEKGGKVCLALDSEPVLFDKPPQDYVSGKKNVMGVRPMDIVFDAKSPIRATIQRDTFLGNQYDYQVELMGKELRVERNALDVLADPTRYEAGQEVGLKFLNVKFYEEGAKA